MPPGRYDYVLYAPSNYVNFPHPTKGIRSMPISGYVLIEKSGRFYGLCGFVDRRGQTKSLQFKVRDQVTYGKP